MLVRILALVGLMLSIAGATTVHAQAEALEWTFKVLLDGREIGYHDFRVSGDPAARRVESEAAFDVRILFVNAYRYRHRTVETWRDNCLTGLEASTNANGKRFAVQGKSADSGFVVSSGGDAAALPNCVMSFAYWNPDFLDNPRLLNSQTGEYEQVTVRSTGRDAVMVDGTSVIADRYELSVKGKPVRLWYDAADGRWLALESIAAGDRLLRYEPVSVPSSVQFSVIASGPVERTGG